MPQSLVKLLAHIIFSTKNRVNLITPEIEHDHQMSVAFGDEFIESSWS